MTLADFTKPGLIAPHLRARDAASAIHELSLALHRAGAVPDFLQFYNAALNREFLLDTGLQPGVACPHARLLDVPEVAFAFGRADEPFAWGTRPGPPVRFVFLVAVPSEDSTQFLSLMASVARMSGDGERLRSLQLELDPGVIFETFHRFHVRACLPAQAT
jgi:mannitol/fructose-specific phosphotransferase system IIA component (Ntr-type)